MIFLNKNIIQKSIFVISESVEISFVQPDEDRFGFILWKCDEDDEIYDTWYPDIHI